MNIRTTRIALIAISAVIAVAVVVPTATADTVGLNTSPTVDTTYDVTVKRPFIPTSAAVIKMASGKSRFTARSVNDDTVRLVSERPVMVKMRLVKTGKPRERQVDNRSVRVTSAGVNVKGLLSGRTYQIVLPGGKVILITPMKRVTEIGGMNARFSDSPTIGIINANHIWEWSRADSNVQYRWYVRQYLPSVGGGSVGVTVGNMVTTTADASAPLPRTGYVQIDVVAVNPVGASISTFYTSSALETLWAANGAGGQLPLSTVPPMPEVPTEKVDTAKEAKEAASRANDAANRADYAAGDAKRAAGEAMAAEAAGDAERAKRSANAAHDAASRAAAAAIAADNWKNQIDGDRFREQRIEAEAAAQRAKKAAEDAAYAATDASTWTVEAWKNEAIARMNELINGHQNLTYTVAEKFAEDLASRSRFAVTQASLEAGRIDSVKSPEAADAASLDVSEANEAANVSEAYLAMIQSREAARRAAVDALTPQVAWKYTQDAQQAADRVRAEANATTLSPYKEQADDAAQQAQVFADAAKKAAEDVQHRYDAQQAQHAAEDARDAARDAITVDGDKDAARQHLEDARDASTLSDTEANAVSVTSDEKVAADEAARKAREAADAAEQWSIASQEILNEAIVIDGNSLLVGLGGGATFTFSKNPNDIYGLIEYVVTATNGSTTMTGTQVDNGDGTVTASFAGLSAGAGWVFNVTPTSYGERTSANPSSYAPAPISAGLLAPLLTMEEASVIEVCGETAKAIGTMEGSECVATKPLTYDTSSLEYVTTPYTYTSTYGWVGRTTRQWGYQGGQSGYGGSFPYWWSCTYSPQIDTTICSEGTNDWQITGSTKDAAPAGYADYGNGVYTATTPNAQPSRAASIDSHFSNTSWVISGGQYVAVSPLPASNSNTALHSYVYEAGKNLYVTRNIPAISKTFKPVFTSLPNGVISWKDATGVVYTELVGADTGRFTTVVTVYTVGGPVQVTGPTVNGTAVDR